MAGAGKPRAIAGLKPASTKTGGTKGSGPKRGGGM
jgi:hypothetical protein